MLTNKFADQVGSHVPSVSGNETAFFKQSSTHHQEFMLADLAKSGLTPELMGCSVHAGMPLVDGATAGYLIPYYGLDGRLLRVQGELAMYRIRQRGGSKRYVQPSGEVLAQYDLPPTIPYVLPDFHALAKSTGTMVICEGEKKAASVMHHLGLPAVGIGGCWNWGIKKKLHPWLVELIRECKIAEVVIIPDGDIKRYDICTAYGTLAGELGRLGLEVEIVELPSTEDKIDDLIVAWGENCVEEFASLGKFGADGLVEDQATLAELYGLSCTGVGDKLRVVNNDNNIARLLSEHPAFGDFWLNADTGEHMHGTEPVQWGLTDFQLLIYMQHYFQLHNITLGRVSKVIAGLCAEDTRSPFREWVDSHVWDGVERLGDWPIRLWGCKDTIVSREVGLKFMVGMYARMASPGCKMDWMMVTCGGQGIGKSWWADLVSGGNFVSFMASGNARDDMAKLHRGLVILIDELDAFNKREMTYWKTMITTTEDTYRPAYGQGEVVNKRSSVLYGTTNHKSFLRYDSTGQRRFGVLEPSRMLDVEGFKAELGQLWAEARALYESGEVAYWELSAEAKAEASEFQGDDPLVEKLQAFIDQVPVSASTGDKRFRMLDVLGYLGMDNMLQARALTGQIKDMLVHLGCEHRSKIRIGKITSAGYIYVEEQSVGG